MLVVEPSPEYPVVSATECIVSPLCCFGVLIPNGGEIVAASFSVVAAVFGGRTKIGTRRSSILLMHSEGK